MEMEQEYFKGDIFLSTKCPTKSFIKINEVIKNNKEISYSFEIVCFGDVILKKNFTL